MSNIISDIKNMAHNVTEGFLKSSKPINGQISDLYFQGKIGNYEILKRVCETVNQSVYLSLFNDSSVDNANIQFEYANYDKLLKDIKENEDGMSSYSTPPEDFRASLDSVIGEAKVAEQSEFDKLASVNVAIRDTMRVDGLVESLKTLREKCAGDAEQAYIAMEKHAKLAIGAGDSLGDLSKLACRFVDGAELGTMKVAAAYNMMSNDLKAAGHNFSEEFTKVSSQNIIVDSSLYTPIEKFATAVGEVEALDEMIASITKVAEKAFGGDDE